MGLRSSRLLVVAALGALAVVGCSAPTTSAPSTSSQSTGAPSMGVASVGVASVGAAPGCAQSDLAVTVSGGVLRAANRSGHACALSGKYAVVAPWWRVVDPEPRPPRGVLAPGAVLVQAYRYVASNGCPGGAMGRGTTTTVPVTVEDHPYDVPMATDLAYQLTICDEVSAYPPVVVTTEDAAHATLCDVRALGVSVDADLTIDVENAGRSTCRLRGTPAVSMKVGRLVPPLPATDVALLPGELFVQPQTRATGTSACATPISAGLPRRGLWTVVVQDQTVHPAASDGPLVAQVVNCWVVSLPAGHVSDLDRP